MVTLTTFVSPDDFYEELNGYVVIPDPDGLADPADAVLPGWRRLPQGERTAGQIEDQARDTSPEVVRRRTYNRG